MNFRTEKSEKMTVEENARLEASIADAISVQQQFFHNQFTEANAHSEKVCIALLTVLLVNTTVKMLEARGTDACSILYIKFQKFSSMTLQALMTFDKDTMNDTLVLADELLSICSSLGAQVNLLSNPGPFLDECQRPPSNVNEIRKAHAFYLSLRTLEFE